MKEPLVSVIIPAYNRKDAIKRAVDSVLAQTYKNIELIVIDDGSVDGTLEILQEWKDERIRILKQKHRGANAARNLGIKSAKGEFIAFQDSDDEWLPDKLEKQITYMSESNYAACYCPFLKFFEEGEFNEVIPTDYADKEKHEKNLLEELRKYNIVSTQTLVIHRSIVENIGLFDEDMPRLQDYEYVVRIIQKAKIGYVNIPLVKVYYSDNSISSNAKYYAEACMMLLKKHGDFFDTELFLKNKLDYVIHTMDESEVYLFVEKMDDAVKSYIKDETISTYKMALELLYHNFRLTNHSYVREYEMKVSELRTGEFAIYGAGTIGKRVYRELLRKQLKPRCFLVTKKDGHEELNGIPIIELADWKEKDLEIIVGVSYEMQRELIENLIKMGHKNYFRYPPGLYREKK